jgi:hypothetical protein
LKPCQEAMLNHLKSRAAARKLSVIVGLLLIPVLFMGYSMLKLLFEEQGFVGRQVKSQAIIGNAIPVFDDVANGKPAQSAFTELAALTPIMTSGEIRIDTEFSELQNVISPGTATPDLILEKASALVRAAGDKGALQSDASAGGHSLASLVAEDMPRLYQQYLAVQHLVQQKPDTFDADPKALWRYLAQMGQAVGRLSEAQDAVSDTIKKTAANDQDQAASANLLKSVDRLDATFGSLATMVALQDSEARHIADGIKSTVTASAPLVLADFKAIWETSLQQLKTRTATRSRTNTVRTWTTTLLTLVASLLGIGSAFHFFRSTLKTLDEVTESRDDIDTARREAEDTNGRLSAINEDVVRLNTELADKMSRLKNAQDELLKKGRMEQLGQLTATVAHELRNPLGAVRTSAFLLEDQGQGAWR